LKYLSNKKGFLGTDNKNNNKENVVVVPFGLEKTVSYGRGTNKAPKEIIKASHQVELFDEDLNKEPYNNSSILLTGKNFGCGSSREHAPWALLDFGIKCIIGPSFADIFYNNCFKNSMLPIVLSQNNLEEIVEYSKRKEIVEINLTKQEIKFGNTIINFKIDPFKKECLLNGLDDISLSLEKSEKISSYEENLKKTKPWTN